MGFFFLDPQGPPSWGRLSSFLLPLVLLSPVDASRGFMFPSCGMLRSNPTLPHQGVMMFHTTPPSGVPRRGITTPPFLPIMFSMMVRDYSSYARHVHLSPIILCLIFHLTGRDPTAGETWSPGKHIPSTYV